MSREKDRGNRRRMRREEAGGVGTGGEGCRRGRKGRRESAGERLHPGAGSRTRRERQRGAAGQADGQPELPEHAPLGVGG